MADVKKEKTLDLFNWKNKEKCLRHSVCKECHSEYRREHYLANRRKYITKARKWNHRQKDKTREVLLAYLRKHPCVDCGEKDIVVLDFDHKKDKLNSIAQMVSNYYSIPTILKEIKKCEVRCSNCHRRKTFKERGYWKALM